jgi:hypothetical protein
MLESPTLFVIIRIITLFYIFFVYYLDLDIVFYKLGQDSQGCLFKN